jgi:hypothetical protein
MGKYDPFSHSEPDSESFAVSFIHCVGNAVSFTRSDVCISRFQPRSNGVGWFYARAGSFAYRGSKPSQQTEAMNAI